MGLFEKLYLLAKTALLALTVAYYFAVISYYSKLSEEDWQAKLGCTEETNNDIRAFYYSYSCVQDKFRILSIPPGGRPCSYGCYVSHTSTPATPSCYDMKESHCNRFRRNYPRFKDYFEKRKAEGEILCLNGNCQFLDSVGNVTFFAFILTPVLTLLLSYVNFRDWRRACSKTAYRKSVLERLETRGRKCWKWEWGYYMLWMQRIIPYVATPLIDGDLLLHRVMNYKTLKFENENFDVQGFANIAFICCVLWLVTATLGSMVYFFRRRVKKGRCDGKAGKCFKGANVGFAILVMSTTVMTIFAVGLGCYLKVQSLQNMSMTQNVEQAFRAIDFLYVVVIIINLVLGVMIFLRKGRDSKRREEDSMVGESLLGDMGADNESEVVPQQVSSRPIQPMQQPMSPQQPMPPRGPQPMPMQQPMSPRGPQPMPMQQPMSPRGPQPMPMQQPMSPRGPQPMPMQQPMSPRGPQPMPMQQPMSPRGPQPMPMQQPMSARSPQPMPMQQPMSARGPQPMPMQQPMRPPGRY